MSEFIAVIFALRLLDVIIGIAQLANEDLPRPILKSRKWQVAELVIAMFFSLWAGAILFNK